MGYIFQLLIILVAAYAVLNVLNNSRHFRGKDYIWFFYIFLIIAGAIILINLFGSFKLALKINILGIVKFLLLIMGVVAQGFSIFQMLMVLKRRGMVNQRIGSVILLDIATIVVIFGLYYIRA